MATALNYIINNQLELNLSYMPFIKDCGLFIPTNDNFNLGDIITLNLQLPGQTHPFNIEAEIIWITPKNALYHIYQGIGVRFKGEHAKSLCEEIKANLDDTMDVGGYTYGLAPESSPKNEKKKERKTKSEE